jgi:hydroxymethylglutaryl-CoA lyase
MWKRYASNIVKIVEVGPRDGLQNEKRIIPTATKVKLIDLLSNTGLKNIEVSSFVSPKWVPQLGDASLVLKGITKSKNVNYSVLVPNLKGLEGALAESVQEIAIFGAATEGFTRKNVNCSIKESITRFKDVALKALEKKLKIRGYVSVVVGCPYEGKVNPKQVLQVVKELKNLGCYEISLGDTIGVGRPKEIKELLQVLSQEVKMEELAIHCHDTYGMAIANIYQALEVFLYNL